MPAIMCAMLAMSLAAGQIYADDMVSAAKVEVLIKQLGAPKFRDREQAEAKLADLGDAAYEVLERHKDHADPEIRARIEALLTRLRGSLTSVDPKREKTLKSGTSGRAVRLAIENRSTEVIRIFWLNFKGKRQAYGSPLKHGANFRHGTYESHVWIITDQRERVLGLYVIGKTDARIVVRPRK